MSVRRKSLIPSKASLLLILAWYPTAPLWGMDQNLVPWVKDLPTAMEIAKQRNQLVLVHFTSDSCPPCRRLEQQVFNQPYFGHAVSQTFVPVCVNVTLQPKIASDYQVQSWPTDVVLTPNGDELHRMTSPQDGAQYLRILQQVAWNHQQHQSSSSTAILAGYRTDQGRTPPNSSNSPVEQVLHRSQPASAPGPSASSIYGSPTVASTSAYSQSPAEPPVVTYSTVIPSNAAPATSIYGSAAESSPQYVDNPYLASAPPASAQVPSGAPPMTAMVASAPQVELEPDSRGSVQGTAFVTSAGPSAPNAQDIIPFHAYGLDGYCPVAVMDENKWEVGDRQWGAQHRGRVYLFRDAASQQRFLANPERYAPALAGFDPVLVTESGQYLPGRREHGVRYNDRMYLFGSEESLQKFSGSPDEFVARIDEALKGLATR